MRQHDIAYAFATVALVALGVYAYYALLETELLQPAQQWRLDIARWRGAVLAGATDWYDSVCASSTDELLAWRRTCLARNKTDAIEGAAPPLTPPLAGAHLPPDAVLACAVALPLFVAWIFVALTYARASNSAGDRQRKRS